jgi:hypothetical protein
MASNHSFIQGGVSTLPSFLGIKKAPWRGSMYEQAIVINLITKVSFLNPNEQTLAKILIATCPPGTHIT